ncbi:hypothetical protein OLG77_01635 [Streptococcus pneumoniae]|uniref:hypothetical protein n=1 Tax=Streptococcus intermedius TaxID=1338 RepID=UPI00123A8026|nr:hypothetical protein [Streptococcus intermedius]MDG9557138.1 hypothetical protein [Streptococcus pneumoniae]
MFKNLIDFIETATPEQIKCMLRKANALEGDVTLLSMSSVNIVRIKNALLGNTSLELKKVRIDVIKKLAYASNRNHYADGATMMDDISAGKTHRHAKSYV